MKHDDWLLKKLQDAEFAREYLNAAKGDKDPETYLSALQQVALLSAKAHFSEERHDEKDKNEV